RLFRHSPSALCGCQLRARDLRPPAVSCGELGAISGRALPRFGAVGRRRLSEYLRHQRADTASIQGQEETRGQYPYVSQLLRGRAEPCPCLTRLQERGGVEAIPVADGPAPRLRLRGTIAA